MRTIFTLRTISTTNILSTSVDLGGRNKHKIYNHHPSFSFCPDNLLFSVVELNTLIKILIQTFLPPHKTSDKYTDCPMITLSSLA